MSQKTKDINLPPAIWEGSEHSVTLYPVGASLQKAMSVLMDFSPLADLMPRPNILWLISTKSPSWTAGIPRFSKNFGRLI